MSTTVDNRVVEMRFENKQFESNAANTMSTLDKLKKSLKLDGASKGFENLDAAAKKVDMGHLGNAVEAVRTRFSALEVMGVTALVNITNQAVNAGKKLASAFTIEPIKTGFQEYETQIGAIQTILANTESKGTTLGDVNNALDTLNTYADKTIYNFTEMTRNIGTFTAAGVDLEKSVSSIQGIANLAAVSGSTSQQASTAMYQLSQALAAGRVSLMDWNSVVNAGMGGQVFQDALKRTSEVMGTGAEAAIKEYGSFRESLTKGEWLTTDVLTKTLEQFTMAAKEGSAEWEKYKKSLMDDGYSEKQALDILKMANTATDAATKVKTVTQLFDTLKEATQSGWTQTWELLIGDFGEAKDLLTEVSDTLGEIIGKSAESRNKILSGGLQSNWSKLTSKITESGIELDTFENKIKEVAKSHDIDIDKIIQEHGSLQKAFKEGAISSDILKEAVGKLGGSLADLSKIERTLKKGSTGEDVKEVQKALKGLGHDIGKSGIDGVLGKDTESAIKAFQELKGLEVTGIVDAKTLKALKEAAGDTKNLSKECDKFIKNITKNGGRENLIDALRNSFKGIMSVVTPIKEAFTEIFPPVTANTIYRLTENIKKFSEGLILSGEKAEKVKRIFKGVFSIFDIARKAITSVVKALFGLSQSEGIGSLADLFLDTAASIGDFFTTINEKFDASGLTGLLSGVSEGLSGLFKGVSSGLSGFGKVISSIGGWIVDVAGDIWSVIKGLFTWISDNVSAGDIFAGLAGGGIFALAKNLSDVCDKVKDTIDKLFGKGGDGGGIQKLKDVFKDVLGSVKESLQAFTTGIKVASLVSIAIAIALLSSSLKKISQLRAPDIGKSLLAMALMFTMLTKAFDAVTKSLNAFPSKGLISAGISMILMAKAVDILADAITEISKLSLGEIAKGLIGVGGGLLILVKGVQAINGVKIPISTALSILALAKACDMLGDALQKFGAMAWDEIGRGLTAMGGALVEFVAAISVLGKTGGFSGLIGSVSVLIAVQALDELSENLKRFGSMAWDEIGRGLTAMGAALTELGVVFGALGYLTGFSGILGAGTILIGVQALDELSENLKRFGSMNWDEIWRGLTAMGLALTELGVVFGALGYLTGFAGILGAGAILIGVQGLGDLADALVKFGSMSWDEIWRGLTAMGLALTELGVVSGLLSYLAPFAALGSGSLLLAIQGLDDLAKALLKFGSMSWDEVKSGLAAMGGALGELALGGLLNTLSIIGAASISEMAAPLGVLADSVKKWSGVTLPENLGSNLGALGRALTWFAFKEGGASALATAAPAVGIMADSVKKWSGVTLPEGLTDNLKTLAEGVRKFMFDSMGASALSTAAPALGTMADSVKKWVNVKVPADIGDQLSSLADGIKSFSWAFMGGWSLSAIAGPLGELAGDISKWKNVSMPASLPTQLKDLSEAIMSFSWAFMGGWSIGAIVGPLGDLAGDVTKWNGVSIPKNLPDQLSSLADAIKGFSWAFLGGWSLSAITGPLGDLASDVKKWNGVTIPSGLGKSLTDLAGGVKAFSGIGNISAATKSLSSIASSTSKLAGVNLKSIASGLSSFSTSLKAFALSSSSLSGVGTKIVNNIVSPLKKAASQMSGAGSNLIISLTKGIQSRSNHVTSTTQNIIVKMSKAISSKNTQFNSAGTKLMSRLALGVSKSSPKVKSAVSGVMKAAVTGVKEYNDNFEGAGKSIAEGLARGITANTGIPVAKAKAMARAAYEAARKELDVNSPSKIFRSLGYSIPEGLAMGIDKLSKLATRSAVDMADSTISTVSSSLSRIADYVNSDIDAQPTISPVLDLSNVKAGASTISGMLSGRTTLSVGTQMANAVATSMSNRQNGNTDVVTAINKLRKDLANINGTTYQINGITYSEGTEVSDAINTLVRAAKRERRV